MALLVLMQLIFDGLPDAMPLERVAQQDDQGDTAGRSVLTLEQLPANQDQQQNVQAGKDGIELQPALITRTVELLELI